MVSERGHILVTGSASGIGADTVRVLMEQGWLVSAVDVQEQRRGDASPGHSVSVYTCDMRDADACDRLVVECEDRYGPLEGLVHCAGINHREPFLAEHSDRWHEVIDVNIHGTRNICRAVGSGMVGRGRGSIVLIASMYSMFGGMNVSAYSASKAATAALVKCMALEWGAAGIRVNAISPGWIETPLTASAFSDDEYRERIVSRTALGRLGKASDVSEVIASLLSGFGFVTGSIITVDGGYSAGDVGLVPLSSE